MVDQEIARSAVKSIPKKKKKHYEDFPIPIETIIRFHDHDRGAVKT
jgi:hypothetical protein